uniref:Non-structural polyprotein 1AB n=1 Tax=Carnarvon virus TaxID=2776962 RepID=A0A8E4VR17_9VIRU|nr:MAG: non-structural polyprotein [Carnarvon virus]
MQASVTKVVNPQGLNTLYARAKTKFRSRNFWNDFDKESVVLYPDSINRWYGLNQEGEWLHYDCGNVENYWHSKESGLPKEYEDYMKNRLYEITRKKAIVAYSDRVNTEMRTLKKEGELLRVEFAKTLAQLGRERVRNQELRQLYEEQLQETKNIKNLLLESEEKRNRFKWRLSNIKEFFLIVLVFIALSWFSVADACEVPAFGCTIVQFSPSDAVPMDYHHLVRHCWNDEANIVSQAQIDMDFLMHTCYVTVPDLFVDDTEFCRTRIQKMLASNCTFTGYYMAYLEPLVRFKDSLLALHAEVKYWGAETLILSCFIALCIQDKARAVVSIVINIMAYLTGAKLLPLMVIVNYLPMYSAFLAIVYLFVSARYMALFAIVHWILLVLKAILDVDQETHLFQRISISLVHSVIFLCWQLVNEALKLFTLSIVNQILIMVLIATVSVGFQYAVQTITVTHPDGSVTRHKRVSNVAKTLYGQVVAQMQKAKKVVRGVMPSFPPRTDAIIRIEVNRKGSVDTGVGFRLGNYIYTCGHVVRGAEKVTLKWNNLTVNNVPVLGYIECPLYTDNIAQIQIPKAYALLPSFKLAKEGYNNYFQMATYDQNDMPKTFTGWGTIDGNYFSAPFDSFAGTSGSPIYDSTGKVVAMHFGSNLVMSSGYVLLNVFSQGPSVGRDMCDYTTPAASVVQPESTYDVDEIVRRCVAGVRESHTAILKKIEELDEQTKLIERRTKEAFNRVDKRHEELQKTVEVVDKKSETLVSAFEERLINILEDRLKNLDQRLVESFVKNSETLEKRISAIEHERIVDQFIQQKKKGKTKCTVRGMKSKLKPTRMTKAQFMKQKILSEEEYNRLQEEGVAPERIKEIVDQLREEAWYEYLENLSGSDWEDDMLEADEWNEKIDAKYDSDGELIERAFGGDQDFAYGPVYAQKAKVHFEKHTPDKSSTVKVTVPDGDEEKALNIFNKVVTENAVPEGVTTVAYYLTDGRVIYVENKELNLKHVSSAGDVVIKKDAITTISGPPQAQTIVKKSTTTKETTEETQSDKGCVEEQKPAIEEKRKKHESVQEQAKEQPKEQRRGPVRYKCSSCGEDLPRHWVARHRCQKNLSKKLAGEGIAPVPEELKWYNWRLYLDKGFNRVIPDGFPFIGSIKIDRRVVLDKTKKDCLLNIINKPEVSGYGATQWGLDAYKKTFEKFSYGNKTPLTVSDPELDDFATRALLKEISYMEDSRTTPIVCTTKNLESTPGFPKMQVYDTEKDYIFAHGMSEYVDSLHEFKDKRPLWYCFLKNEIIKEKKIKEQDIRVITCADPVFTRIGAFLDQDQNTRMKENTETHHAQVGWTPFFGGIHQRLQRITSSGRTLVVELDWTRFDGTIPNWLFRKVRLLRWFLVNHEERAKWYPLAKWYTRNLLHRYTLFPTGDVTLITKGNPSGQYSTTVDNNLVNEYLTAAEIGYLYRKQHGHLPTVEDYRKNVDFLCYGDDRLLAINPQFCHYSHEDVISFYEQQIGMWVKPENLKTFEGPEGSSFCGFTFFKVNGVWVGAMNADKILQSLKTPVRSLPDIESLWGKLISLRILLAHSDKKHRNYLDEQIARVETYARAEGIELPEVGPNFYNQIWSP